MMDFLDAMCAELKEKLPELTYHGKTDSTEPEVYLRYKYMSIFITNNTILIMDDTLDLNKIRFSRSIFREFDIADPKFDPQEIVDLIIQTERKYA